MFVISGLLIYTDLSLGLLTIYFGYKSDYFEMFEQCNNGIMIINISIICLDFCPSVLGLLIYALDHKYLSKIKNHPLDSYAISTIFLPLIFNLIVGPLALIFIGMFIGILPMGMGETCRMFFSDHLESQTMIMIHLFKSTILIIGYSYMRIIGTRSDDDTGY